MHAARVELLRLSRCLTSAIVILPFQGEIASGREEQNDNDKANGFDGVCFHILGQWENPVLEGVELFSMKFILFVLEDFHDLLDVRKSPYVFSSLLSFVR